MTYPGQPAGPSSQTIDIVDARWDATVGAIVGRLRVQAYGRRILLMELQAPKNTTLTIYRGPDVLAGFRALRVFPADARTYDNLMTQSPILVYPGTQWAWAWTGGNASSASPNNVASCTVTSEIF